MTRFASIVALTLAAASVDAHAKCAMVAIVPKPLTAANTAIAPGDGVLVGLTYGGRDDRNDEVVENKDWRFKQGGRLVAPTIRVLAPGLAVYVMPDNATTLVDGKGTSIVAVRRGAAGRPLDPPSLTSAAGGMDGMNEKWGPEAKLTLELSSPRPANAIGAILYVGDKPVHWVSLDAKTTTIDLTHGGHCSNEIPGSSVPTSGSVSIAWFDSTGRTSTPSAAIAIKKK